MDVADILTNIRNQALIGNSGLAADTTKLVAYLNIAYRKLYDLVVRNYPHFVSTTQTVTITSGSGTFSPVPYYVLSVRNSGAGYAVLDKKDVEAIQQTDPSLSATGAPYVWYMSGFSTIKTYPINSTTLVVRYVPDIVDLTAVSLEADIAIPPMFHDCLMYETLKTLAYDERDKITGAEMAILDKLADDNTGRLMTYLQHMTGQEVVRTRGVL